MSTSEFQAAIALLKINIAGAIRSAVDNPSKAELIISNIPHFPGMELLTKVHPVNAVSGPTPEQVAALHAWAGLHGRAWKAKLQRAWERSGERTVGYGPALQQLRNQLGPTWLTRYRLS